MTYGDAVPAITPRYSGFVNRDTVAGLTSAPSCGTKATSASQVAGSPYATSCSGAAAPNYTISYANGALTVTKAPLTATAADASRLYGAANPTFMGVLTGVKNNDAIAASYSSAATPGSTVGSYAIAPALSAPAGVLDNYSVTLTNGALTVTPAPLTITADDKTTPYGRAPAYTWTSAGWVNEESASTLAIAPNSAPTCGARVNAAAVSATTPPGVYSGAITCRNAADSNYAITDANGTLTINPLLSLNEQGLPSGVPHQVTLDGQTIPLPDVGVELAYGSRHSYGFPATVTDGSGAIYITADAGFSGTVTANISDTATYQTMAQAISAALASGGIDNGGQANALTQQFAAVQADIKAGNTAQAIADLHSFAAHGRAQAGKHIAAATAQALLAAAQSVYANQGGTGSV